MMSRDLSFAARTRRYQLSNGLILLVLENHANPTVSLSGAFRAGEYFNPPEKDGLASLTSSMLNKGTALRSKIEIAEELESSGARINFSSNTFTVSLGGQALSHDLPMLIATMAEELRTPSFPSDELDKLKQRVIAGIKEDQDETRVRAYERMTQIVFPKGHPYHRPAGEKLIREIESISVEDIRRFYYNHYGPGSLILAIAGDIDAGQVRDLVEAQLGDWQGAVPTSIEVPFTELQATPHRESIQMREKANCDVVIGHASRLRRLNPDYIPAVIANRALGQSTISSRLGLILRDEMGLTYGINSSFSESGIADGPFTIGVTVAPENIDLAIDTTLKIVNDFISDGIREDELEDEKSSIAGTFIVGLATNGGMANQISSIELYGLGIDYLDRFPGMVKAVTRAQVNEAIHKYLHPEVATTIIAGSFE
ncbi:MAG: M16 family metallopeptidase [Blastocatellia bacterium]|jgi:zinc protease